MNGAIYDRVITIRYWACSCLYQVDLAQALCVKEERRWEAKRACVTISYSCRLMPVLQMYFADNIEGIGMRIK